MSEDQAALVAHFEAMRAALLGAIEGLSDRQLTERSLDGWSVKDHLAHLAFWDDIRASEVARISAGFASAWRMAVGEDEAFGAIAYRARKGLSLEQVRWELSRSHTTLLSAIRAATSAGLDPACYGEAALKSTHEAQHTGWIHAWRARQGF